MLTIAIIATLDTKEAEAAFLADCIQKMGGRPFLVDTGMMFDPKLTPNIDRHTLLKAGGVNDLAAAENEHGKVFLMDAMTRGLVTIISDLCASGEIDGVLSIGGAQGTAMSTAAMRALPIGFPKVMVSTIACGTAQFGDYVGTKDIVMIPSLCDICGINSITAPVFSSACSAVIGMAQVAKAPVYAKNKLAVAITMAGITTLGAMKVKELLDAKGYETLVFHCNGVGAIIIDELARENKIDAVVDFTRHDVSGRLFDGLMQCEDNRFENVYRAGIPVISVPGAEDIVLVGPLPIVREDLKGLPYYVHTPFHTHVRTDAEKMYRAGRFVADQHKQCTGPNAIMIPEKGYSRNNAEGRPIYDAAANAAYVKGVMDNRADKTNVVLHDLHINSPAFADAVVDLLDEMLKGKKEY